MNYCQKQQWQMSVSNGLFISSGSESVAEVASLARFDWLIIDMEHGLGDEAVAARQIDAVNRGSASPIIRIPALRAEYIKRVLDLGAAGVMAPMIGSAEEAADFVRFMRYPPEGIRGISSGNKVGSFGFAFADYFAKANRQILTVAQIENAGGVADSEAIAAVDGIDVLFIGHSDLSLQLGCFGQFEHPVMLAAEQKVLDACRKHGKIAGMLLKEGMSAESFIAKGFRFLGRGTDLGIFKSGLKKICQTPKQGENDEKKK